MSITSDLTSIKNRAEGLADNKVSNLAYDSTAYSENIVASPESYDWSQHNNIPQQTASAMKMTDTFIDKGWRLRFPILNKYFFNAFFGRVSYNLNKLTDFFYSLLDALVSSLGSPNGLATLDSNGRIPASQATETLMTYKGGWSASTNTPALSDGIAGAVKGDMYLCEDTGTVTFGTGNTWSFLPNDRVVYNGTKWSKWSAGNVRRVSEIFPDGNGNVDLTQQNDITKVLNPKVLGELFYQEIGRKWVKCTGDGSHTFRGATYGNGIWVAFASAYGLYWSEDGKSWTQTSTTELQSCDVRYARYLNGVWVAGSIGHGIWWSEDGKSWTQGTGIDVTANSYDVTYINGLFVAGTNTGMWWSEDGRSWTQGTGATSVIAYYIKYTNNLFVVCTNSGIWHSTDGKAWTQATGISGYVYAVAFSNDIWVATTDNAGMWYSTNGKSWTQTSTTSIRSYGFKHVIYAVDRFIAGSAGHGMWYSTDGKAWTQILIGNSLTFSTIRYINSTWLACSTNGGLFLSQDGTVWFNVLGESVSSAVPYLNIAPFQGMLIFGGTSGLYYSDWTTV